MAASLILIDKLKALIPAQFENVVYDLVTSADEFAETSSSMRTTLLSHLYICYFSYAEGVRSFPVR
jgi:hypothetical protein